MFLEVNNLVFLLIFLSYAAVCMAVYRRRRCMECCENTGCAMAGQLFLCTVAALLLTALTICLWFVALLAAAFLLKYLCRACIPKNLKTAAMAALLVWMALVAAAGIQFMQGMRDDEDDASVFQNQMESSLYL